LEFQITLKKSVIVNLTETIAANFVSVQLEHANNQTVRSRLWMLQACWEYAKGKYKIADLNPWSVHIAKIKSGESKKVKPFPAIEVQAILNAFKHHQHYSHYYSLSSQEMGIGTKE
jgi:integrase